MRIILDFVPNHTSDRHPWFLESRSSRDAAKADWYMWHDPAPGLTRDRDPDADHRREDLLGPAGADAP